jgi:hypothetical protein
VREMRGERTATTPPECVQSHNALLCWTMQEGMLDCAEAVAAAATTSSADRILGRRRRREKGGSDLRLGESAKTFSPHVLSPPGTCTHAPSHGWPASSWPRLPWPWRRRRTPSGPPRSPAASLVRPHFRVDGAAQKQTTPNLRPPRAPLAPHPAPPPVPMPRREWCHVRLHQPRQPDGGVSVWCDQERDLASATHKFSLPLGAAPLPSPRSPPAHPTIAAGRGMTRGAWTRRTSPTSSTSARTS